MNTQIVSSIDLKSDIQKKTVTITFVGYAGEVFTPDFVKQLNNEVNKIDPSKFTLVIDCVDLRVFKNEKLYRLREAFALYKSFGFNEIVFINPLKATPRLQLKRIAKEEKLPAKFISKEEFNK